MEVTSLEDLIDRVAHFDSFRIAENTYTSRWLLPQLMVDTTDLLADSSTVAALVLYWGLEAAKARRAKARADAAYKSWRDRMFLEIKNTPLENSKYPSEASAEAAYRTLPDYGLWQQKIADAQEQAEQAEAVYEAFRAKKDMIIAQQKMLADQSGGSYYVVESQRKTPPRTPVTSSSTPTPEVTS
jgi:hypothetical protein